MCSESAVISYLCVVGDEDDPLSGRGLVGTPQEDGQHAQLTTVVYGQSVRVVVLRV